MDSCQPLDSQLLMSQEECESGADNSDCWTSFGFIEAVKTVVHHLLCVAISKYMHDLCYGSYMNQPSLRDHQCVDELVDRFFESKYFDVMQVLYNTELFSGF